MCPVSFSGQLPTETDGWNVQNSLCEFSKWSSAHFLTWTLRSAFVIMLYIGNRLFFNLLVLEMCLFSPPKKFKKTKFTEKSTTAHTQRMADVTVSWGLRLTRRVLEKICVHNLKHRHICLDTGPRTYPHINLWNQWSQCSYYENWVEYGASSSIFGPVSSGWVNWHRNICKRTPQNNLQPHGQFRKVAYDSLMCRKPFMSCDTRCCVGGRSYKLKMHWKFDNWIRHKKEFPEGGKIHIFSPENDF